MILAFDKRDSIRNKPVHFRSEHLSSWSNIKGEIRDLSGKVDKRFCSFLQAEYNSRYSRLNKKGVFPEVRVPPPDAEIAILDYEQKIGELQKKLISYVSDHFQEWRFFTFKEYLELHEPITRERARSQKRDEEKSVADWRKRMKEICDELGVEQ